MAVKDPALKRKTGSLKARLSELEGVICIYLFGSVARGDTTALSDIDLAVLLRPGVGEDFPKVMDLLAKTFGEKADISDLRALPLSVQFRVIRDGILLYVADDLARASFEAQVIDEYLDMEPHREEYLEEWFRDAKSSRP